MIFGLNSVSNIKGMYRSFMVYMETMDLELVRGPVWTEVDGVNYVMWEMDELGDIDAELQ